MPADPAWPEWANGNAYTPFTELMALRRVAAADDHGHDSKGQAAREEEAAGAAAGWTFLSCRPAYSPGGFTRAFGGHVYAQAALAAARTVRAAFVLHSVSGHFLLVGRTDAPFRYAVRVVREGGGYVQRRVDVTQRPEDLRPATTATTVAGTGPDGPLVFTCVCSFKTHERSVQERSRKARLEHEYDVVLRGRAPESWPEAPGVDSPFWHEVEKAHGAADPFPGLDMRKVDMTAYNGTREALDKRQLQYYRILGDMPPVDEDPNLHAAAHLYASDRNSLFPIPNFLGVGDDYSAIASLSHTVVFHADAAGLDMVDVPSSSPSAASAASPPSAPHEPQPRRKWFCIEERIDHVSHGRGLAAATMWDVASGAPVATYMQDGLLRMKPGVSQSPGRQGAIFDKLKGEKL